MSAMIKFDIDKNRSIESNFMDMFSGSYIALNPFYKKVFHDDFDFRGCLKDSFNLIQTVRWRQVMTELGFKNIRQLARALLEIDVSDWKELKDFVRYKRLSCPIIGEDTIPETLLFKYLKYLISDGNKQITRRYSEQTIVVQDNQDIDLPLNEGNIFDVIMQLWHASAITGDKTEIILLRPDHDCPYTLILGDKKVVNSFIAKFEIEGFWTDHETTFYWWIE